MLRVECWYGMVWYLSTGERDSKGFQPAKETKLGHLERQMIELEVLDSFKSGIKTM